MGELAVERVLAGPGDAAADAEVVRLSGRLIVGETAAPPPQ